MPARIDVRVHPVVLAPHFPFTERPHGHIVCRSCGRIATVSFAAEEEVLLERFAARRPPGWFVEGITYSLTGLCRRCHEAQPG